MYGLWHRETDQDNRQNIEKFMSVAVVNEETLVIMSHAMKLSNPEKAYDAPPWPGRGFELKFEEGREEETEAALALLGTFPYLVRSPTLLITAPGSPNGLGAAGYFLVQHKAQLGGVKFVYKIRIFRGDHENTNPHLLFYVDTGSPYKDPEEPEVAKKQGEFTRRNQDRRRAHRAVGQGNKNVLEKDRVFTRTEL
jgi:hypothetical protein